MITLKLIRSKSFDTNGTKGTIHTCVLHGRVVTVNSLNFADEDKDCLKADDKAMTLAVNCKVEFVITPYYDAATESTKKGLACMPAFGFDIAAI